uniref:Tubulointerstitial nephritis antigen n=1 Tax=Vombatus ursinus TaxID=29139 RepID=A0A4X2KMX1_VOMUR
MEKQFVSWRGMNLQAYSTGNFTNLERTRFRRALYKGHYCRTRGCCEDRNDDCVTHFYEANAMCYCDKFCERENSDCCPDYKFFCQEDNLYQKGRHWGSRWTAHNYSQFWGMTLEEGYKFRLGTLPPSPTLLRMNEVTVTLPSKIDLPEFFISSYKWPGWTHDPLDQKNCAASWAFSTASVAADRIAIQSNGRYTANLSPQNLISCCVKNRHGCKGGSIDKAWWYLRKRGLVSHACYPLFKDQIFNNNGCDMASRSDGRGKRHATKPCPNSIEKSNRIYQCSPPYRVSSNETEIMKEIMQNGPVQAIMQVHEDFFHYKTGIYRHVNSIKDESEKYRNLSTHAVKLTGWGVLRGAQGRKEKFWIAANSWGKSWGENGYFRILRGVNESDIEKLIIAAWVLGALMIHHL